MADAIPFWDDQPKLYDGLGVKFGAFSLAPGIAKVEVRRRFKTDKKAGAGTNGATLTVNGQELAEVKITLRIWTVNQQQKIEPFIQALFPGKKLPTPFDFTHPTLSQHRLKSLFVEGLSGPTEKSDGIWEISLDCTEYAPPPPKPKVAVSTTPGTSVPGGTGGGGGRFGNSSLGSATDPIQQQWEVKRRAFLDGNGADPGPRPQANGLPQGQSGPPRPPAPSSGTPRP